jgi:signal transduction histidine kinase
LRERVQLYAGTLRTGPRPDGGYEVHASLPLSSAMG